MKSEPKPTETQKSKPFRSLGSPKETVAPFTGLGWSVDVPGVATNPPRITGDVSTRTLRTK